MAGVELNLLGEDASPTWASHGNSLAFGPHHLMTKVMAAPPPPSRVARRGGGGVIGARVVHARRWRGD
jgi:hypothetical protein